MIHIDYDRTDRKYKWENPESGEVLTAPCGKHNKAELYQQVIALLDPELFQAAVRWIEAEPTLERVIWRGVELVANCGVELFTGEGMIAAKVDSSDEFGRYSITFDQGYLACECPHWQDMTAPFASTGERVCKHLAAFTLHQRTQENRF